MRYSLMAAGIFLLAGGFFVNLPAENYFWFLYDLVLGVGVLIASYNWKEDNNN